ncbi:TPA: hypothetical protein PPN70_004611 [Serratia rubidaea]|nr:hypothetical protein [Serratia rubidaea]MDK1706427.1 hypothetical protein [Serratia rubidaea]HDJ1442151.1 hypothetical protein [Serratia rubidaea]HDJ1451215.1 hypothetical protein [Serratia rubidaea]HDJ1463521.1 hypothetical protein [Serratia rubidaea]HDJ2774579.1 hypothetical protein [Serratia rubidaea]
MNTKATHGELSHFILEVIVRNAAALVSKWRSVSLPESEKPAIGGLR